MIRRSVLLTLCALLLAGTAASASAASGTSTGSVSPIGRHLHLRKGLHVVGSTVRATCTPGSLTVGAAYRCFGGHYIYDPCWPGRNRAGFIRFYCLLRPWDRGVRRLLVDDFEVLSRGTRVSRAPWGIQLASGQRCVAGPGANDMVEGVGIFWYCTETLSLLADLDQTADFWTITEVERGESGTYANLGRQQIARAWFGKRARTP